MRLIALFLLISLFSNAQKLSKGRIQKLRKAVVSISIEQVGHSGTGFYISEKGDLLTCWHVIEPALIRSPINNGIVGSRNVFITQEDGKKIQVGIPTAFIQKSYDTAICYDFCLLQILDSNEAKNKAFFTLGSFDKTEEGANLYTAGYPFGIPNQFVSTGILSTKYIDSTTRLLKNNQDAVNIARHQATLDLTVNKGNSGGPAIVFGKTEKDDKVIGIVSFVITKDSRLGEEAYKILEKFSPIIVTDSVSKQKINLTEMLKVFAENAIYTTNGISGCISIDYFSQLLTDQNTKSKL